MCSNTISPHRHPSSPPPLLPAALQRYCLRSHLISSPLPLHLLPLAARDAVTRFYKLPDKKLALGSQLLQRMLICQTHHHTDSAITLQSVTLWKDPESGRPGYIQPESTPRPLIVDYNVSHHSGLVVLAALVPDSGASSSCGGGGTSRQGEGRIGVDVVPTALPTHWSTSPYDFLQSFTGPSAAIFTAREVSRIHSQPDWPRRVRLFYMYWALKEAYVKATGTGLVTDLTRIEFRNVHLFDLDHPPATRYSGARLHLAGVEQPQWYLELEALPASAGVVSDGGDEAETESKEDGDYYIAIATEKGYLTEADLAAPWKEVNVQNDIEVWDEAWKG